MLSLHGISNPTALKTPYYPLDCQRLELASPVGHLIRLMGLISRLEDIHVRPVGFSYQYVAVLILQRGSDFS